MLGARHQIYTSYIYIENYCTAMMISSGGVSSTGAELIAHSTDDPTAVPASHPRQTARRTRQQTGAAG